MNNVLKLKKNTINLYPTNVKILICLKHPLIFQHRHHLILYSLYYHNFLKNQEIFTLLRETKQKR